MLKGAPHLERVAGTSNVVSCVLCFERTPCVEWRSRFLHPGQKLLARTRFARCTERWVLHISCGWRPRCVCQSSTWTCRKTTFITQRQKMSWIRKHDKHQDCSIPSQLASASAQVAPVGQSSRSARLQAACMQCARLSSQLRVLQ